MILLWLQEHSATYTKIKGVPTEGPHDKDSGILGSIWGPPI